MPTTPTIIPRTGNGELRPSLAQRLGEEARKAFLRHRHDPPQCDDPKQGFAFYQLLRLLESDRPGFPTVRLSLSLAGLHQGLRQEHPLPHGPTRRAAPGRGGCCYWPLRQAVERQGWLDRE